MNNTIPFHSATHAPQITVDVNILTMLKQAASCLTEAAGKDVYLAAIGPDMELTIIMEEDAPSVLPCFDEDDALISVKGAPLFISYNPAQVLKLAGKRYLTGPVIFYRTDGHSTIVSLTVEDIYRFQTYLESHSTTLMADGQKLTCICIDAVVFAHGSCRIYWNRILPVSVYACVSKDAYSSCCGYNTFCNPVFTTVCIKFRFLIGNIGCVPRPLATDQ